MKNIKALESNISSYFNTSIHLIQNISSSEIMQLVQAIEKVRVNGKMVYVFGNGGSSTTASHSATDIGVGSLRRANPVRVVCLNDSSAVLTALSNDLDFEFVLAEQLKLLVLPGDLILLISASGNSANIVNGVNSALELGASVFSLTGFNGGELRKITLSNNIHVETEIGAYGQVEDLHLAICHVVTECLRAY